MAEDRDESRSPLRVLAVVPAWNEAHRVAEVVLSRIPPDTIDECLLVDDGSSDDTAAVGREAGVSVARHPPCVFG